MGAASAVLRDKQVASSETKVFVKSAVMVGLIGILKKKIKIQIPKASLNAQYFTVYTVSQKKQGTTILSITSPNVDRF